MQPSVQKSGGGSSFVWLLHWLIQWA